MANLMSRLTHEELGQLPRQVLMETISQSSFERPALIMQLHTEPYWMNPFIKYLDRGELTNNKIEAKKISSKVSNYLYEDEVLFKRKKIHVLAKMWRARRSFLYHRGDSPRYLQHS